MQIEVAGVFSTWLSRKFHNAFPSRACNQNVIGVPPPVFPISQENCCLKKEKKKKTTMAEHFDIISMLLSKKVAFG